MIEFDYLYKGLCGLARTHQVGGLAGHLGAALIAGYFFGEDQHELDPQVHQAIEQDLDRIIKGEESIWYDQKKVGVTIPELFKPFPKERPQQDATKHIAQALAANIGQTRQSGHNVIFASTTIRALHDHPEYATPSITSGIVKLINGFNGAVPGRGYYGKQRGWIVGNKVTLPEDKQFPLYASEQALADVVIDDLVVFAAKHRRGFGGLFHIINHAAGLTELTRYGHKELAIKGRPAHRQHVRLWRTLPVLDEELGALKPSPHDPRTPEYWTLDTPSAFSARLTHRIKTLYGFFTLLRFIESEEQRKQAQQQFLYLMG